MLYFVYGLVDPREKGPRAIGYIGCTHISPNDRLQQHLEDKKTLKKATWIQRLLAEQVEPEIEILETVKGDWAQGKARERYWIQFYRAQGAPLTNSQHIGNVPCLPSVAAEEAVVKLVSMDVSFALAYCLEMDLHGVLETAWFHGRVPAWLQQNEQLCWIAGNFGSDPLCWLVGDTRKVPAPEIRDVWASLMLLPLRKDSIYELLRGERTLADVEAGDILSYKLGNVYNCFLSIACRPGKEDHLSRLFEHALVSLAYLGVEIERVYSSASSYAGEERVALMRLVEGCCFSSLELECEEGTDMNWVLSTRRPNPSSALQAYRRERELVPLRREWP